MFFDRRWTADPAQGLEAMKSILEVCVSDKVLPSILHFGALQGLVVGVDVSLSDEECVAALAETYDKLLQSLSHVQLEYHWLCIQISHSIRSGYAAVDPSSRKPTGADISLC